MEKYSTPCLNSIPCLLIKSPDSSISKIMIYYHANGQDLINCYDFVKKMSLYLQIDVLIVEYPGYSIYKQEQYVPSSDKILNDVPFVICYLMKIGYSQQNIVVFGRSIGTGPATFIAAKYKIRGLILLSPFTSFKGIVQSLYGPMASLMTK